MKGFQSILDKLHRFINKYYTNALIKGVLLFIAVGVSYWVLIMALEHWLWLDSGGRLVLFICFVMVELLLLYRFILIPVSRLMRLRKGINEKQASRIIGSHFPNVGDRLLNLLELSEDYSKSELLLASIEQRSNRLQAVNFVQAVSFKDGLAKSKYLFFPIVLLAVIVVSGKWGDFFGSHQRVVQFSKTFEKPAPFKFILLSDSLTVLDNEALVVEIGMEGEVVPDNVNIVLEGSSRIMKAEGDRFVYTVDRPKNGSSFYFEANGWDSRAYQITVKQTPIIADLSMEFIYPKYLGRANEVVSGTGNGLVPEGTLVKWVAQGKAVEQMALRLVDSSIVMNREGSLFSTEKRLFSNLKYRMESSNSDVKQRETAAYELDVVKDRYPSINMESRIDSLVPNTMYFQGKVSDDHGLATLELVYHPSDNDSAKKQLNIALKKGTYEEFFYTFPSGLEVKPGTVYSMYFEVRDNDAVHGGKASRSRVFTTKFLSFNELKDSELYQRQQSIEGLEQTIRLQKEQKRELQELQQEQLGSKQVGFEDKEQLQKFFEKQMEQEDLMEKFTKTLKEGLEESDEESEFKRMLKERLERQEKEAQKNARTLEELQKISDKIDKEQLKRKLDDLSKKQSSSTRNLEQLLELTKRYYVTEKLNQLSRRLEEESEKQRELSKEVNSEKGAEEQQQRNDSFDKIAKELSEVKNENQGLKKPMDVGVGEKETQAVKEDQKKALEELNKNGDGEEGDSQKSKAQQRQKSAADKMKSMSESLRQSSSGSSGSENVEDAEMLRQVLDNLVIFSFKQEALFEDIAEVDSEVSRFSRMVRDQNELRDLFEHVDDSLFSLSLRRPELSEFVNDRIEDVYYNIDKSLESMVENQLYQSASYQQYVLTATNGLSDFLANVLDNMQQSMSSGQGQGQGSDFQLPDIIQGQQSIGEKMGSSGKGQQSGEKGQQSEGEGQDGKEGKQEGEQGQKDGSGQKGEDRGQQGEGGNEGEQGKSGDEGNGKGKGNGQGDELGLEELFEIYKEQQRLRQGLEEQLSDIIDQDKRELAKKVVRQMEEFERELLENGITERTKQKAVQIEYELLKLKNANIQKGERKERESKTETRVFVNPVLTKPDVFKRQGSGVESLNRQALPLQKIYSDRVKQYYQND